MELLNSEVRAAMRLLDGQSERPDDVDPDTLEREVTQIAFNEADATPYGTDGVVFNGVQQHVHNTHQFPTVFGMNHTIMYGSNNQPLREAYLAQSAAERLVQIFEELRQSYPELYKKMVQIVRQRSPQSDNGEVINNLSIYSQKQAAAERTFYGSKAYSAAAKIAKANYPDYDLSSLYEV